MIHRVSHVEQFRQWEADEDAPLDALLMRLQGRDAPSQAMRAGTALHKALELARPGIIERIDQDGFRFRFACDVELVKAPVLECRASKSYAVDGAPIVISGQADAIDGLRIEDHKSTARFDPERYLAGYQWRIYLDIFGAESFRWNVFEMEEVAPEFASGLITYDVFAAHRLEQFSYPGMGDDCRALVERFARFVRSLPADGQSLATLQQGES